MNINGTQFPDGKIRPNDEGLLATTIFVEDGKVIMDFGKKVIWIGFDRDGLSSLIEILQLKLKEIS